MRFTKYIIVVVLLGLVVAPLAAAQTPAPASIFKEIEPSGNIKVPNLFGTGLGGPAGKTTFGGLVTIILQIALLVVGSVAVLFLMYGGYRYITASGNEENAEAAKKIIFNAVLGLVIVVLSFAVITIISTVLVTGAVRGP